MTARGAAASSEDAAKCTLFAADRMVTDSKAKLLESLTEDEKAMVRRVFLTRPLPEKGRWCHAFAAPQLCGGRPDDPERAGRDVQGGGGKICPSGRLFIKTHPRDATDYQALFPEAVVLERTMPSEVLNFCLPFTFARAVTVQSFVLRGFTAAEEKNPADAGRSEGAGVKGCNCRGGTCPALNLIVIEALSVKLWVRHARPLHTWFILYISQICEV